MTTRELLENANLAALGLLDPDEHTEYERALAVAPVAIRQHVLSEQARWSSGGELLPAVDAPPHLRERVMDAVRGAMVDDEISRSAAAMDLPGSRRVHAAWRAGALGLLCACVALSGVILFVHQSENEAMKLRDRLAISEGMQSGFGALFVDSVVFAPNTERILFTPVEPSFGGQLSLYTNDGWKEWRAFSSQMPQLKETERYCLVELDADGLYKKELATFDGHAQTDNHGITPVGHGSRIALVVAGVGMRPTADHILMIATVA